METLAGLLSDGRQLVLGVDVDVGLANLLLGGSVENTGLDGDDVLCSVRCMGLRND